MQSHPDKPRSEDELNQQRDELEQRIRSVGEQLAAAAGERQYITFKGLEGIEEGIERFNEAVKRFYQTPSHQTSSLRWTHSQKKPSSVHPLTPRLMPVVAPVKT